MYGCGPSLRSCQFSLYLCNLFLGGGHDTILNFSQIIICKKARIWTFFLQDRKQYAWFVLFWLAKMTPSISCCWFQSVFLLAQSMQWNTHMTSLWNFCQLSFLEFEECLNGNFIHWNIFHLIVYYKVAVKFTDHLNAINYLIPGTSYRSDKQIHFQIINMNGISTGFGCNSSLSNLRIILSNLRFCNTF